MREMREREREREKERERGRERERKREVQRDRLTHTHTHRGRERNGYLRRIARVETDRHNGARVRRVRPCQTASHCERMTQ
jgi:hypothetical protein